MNNMEVIDGVFHFYGHNTVELAKKYGTPAYILSEEGIKSKLGELRRDFLDKYDNVRVAYAAKAFFTLYMAKLLKKEKMCLDVVSGGELYTAIKAEFPSECIEFNGNNKSFEELDMAIEYGVARIIVDGINELELIEEICKEKDKQVKILFRITPGVASSTHDYIVTGKKDSKFGLTLEEKVVFEALDKTFKMKHVDFIGFHFHVGSQLFDNDSHLEALSRILELTKRVREVYDFTVKELNLGGGFGIKYVDEEPKSFSYFLDPMMEKIEKFCALNKMERPAIVIEPGRSIVGEAGITLYEIGNIKEIEGIRKYISVDGGMTDNIRPALYQAKYNGIVVNKADLPNSELVTVAGKCCESGDILIKDINLPRVERGDILAILSTGAYGFSMSNNYNKLPIPPVVILKEDRDEIIVKRQSYDDLIRNELM